MSANAKKNEKGGRRMKFRSPVSSPDWLVDEGV
jgi:hypothetical protein